jgi:hypothetical protein
MHTPVENASRMHEFSTTKAMVKKPHPLGGLNAGDRSVMAKPAE